MITFRIDKHSIKTFLNPENQVIELWDGNNFIGQITSTLEGTTVRVLSKHRLSVETENIGVNVVAITIKAE